MLCEIPIPDGWEFVRYGHASVGEHILDGHRPHLMKIEFGWELIIVRKQWQPPDFLPEGWIAMDENGNWYWYDELPSFTKYAWHCFGGIVKSIQPFIWERPPVTDWKESLREIKRGAK